MHKPFALYGGEKMLYDVRMGPQAVRHRDVIYIAYQANADGAEAHPHIIAYDLATRTWSDAVQIGSTTHYDHHFAPILWFDREEHIHVLYNCHGRDGGTHVISGAPRSIRAWKAGPQIYKSISYPRVIPLPDDKLLLYYRAFGHMGYWTHQASTNGGYTWTQPRPLIDFDQTPQSDDDTWAGSYQSVHLGADGRSLHIAFVYWDEKKQINPLYGRRIESNNRYHLYYLRLDTDTGQLYTIEGDPVPQPVSRSQAERCKVWNTGHRLTNMPAILNHPKGAPCFLLPVAGESSPWQCMFHFVRRHRGRWQSTAVARANNTWDGCLMHRGPDGELLAYLATGDQDGQMLSYGGGTIEEWASRDGGLSWEKRQELNPEPGLIYNNPKPVEWSTGSALDGYLVLYGWQGPGSIQVQTGSLIRGTPYKIALPEDAPTGNRGRAYLWHKGEWL
jgi:hypothetical protein